VVDLDLLQACRALTCWRPWPQLIAARLKPVENRVHLHTGWRGKLLIHAGLRWDPVGWAMAVEHGVDRMPMHTGYLAVADLVDVHQADTEPCACDTTWAQAGAWHWVLDNVVAFPEPIPGRGRQGLFRPPVEVAARAQELLAAASTLHTTTKGNPT
jgi:hypothetical protein